MTTVTTEEDGDEPRGTELEKLLESQLGNMGLLDGWKGLSNQSLGQVLAKNMSEQKNRMKAEANLFRDVFMTPAGKKLLNVFCDMTVRKTVWPVHQMQSMEMLTAFGIWREAENSFVAAILEAIAVAKNQEPKRRSDP